MKRFVLLSFVYCVVVVLSFFLGVNCSALHAQTPPDSTAVNAAPADSVVTRQTSGAGIIETIQQSRPQMDWSISFAKIFWSAVTLVLALIVIRYLTRLLDTFAERWAHIRLTIKGVIPMIRILSWIAVLYIIIVDILAPPVQTLIAFTASAGIAIGFASQDILKNIFGGVMILLDRPFQVGDKISAGGHYGEVKHIGLRSVRVVTPDDNLVTIPNGELMNASVANANAGETNCQVVAEFFLPSDIDLEHTKRIAYRAAAVSRYVYLNKPIAVVIKNEVHQGRSMLKMRLKAYVLDIRYEFAFMTEMTEIVICEMYRAGILTPEQMDRLNVPDTQTTG